jgi:hypothetical protein
MPRYTETEYRLATNHSHRSKKGSERKRILSPMPKRMGNSSRGGCSFCNPKVVSRVVGRQLLQDKLRTNKEIDFDKLINKLDDVVIQTQIFYHKFESINKEVKNKKNNVSITEYKYVKTRNIELQEAELFL